MNEEWIGIFGWRYQVSSLGRVMGPTGRILSPKDVRGYKRVAIFYERGKRRDVSVHRLVCAAFHGEPPADRPQVDHINAVSHDNRAVNLRWVSAEENLSTRRHPLGTDRPQIRLNDDQVRAIRSAPDIRGMSVILAEQFGVTRHHIRRIQRGKARHYVDT